jgi:hypothetical protein
MQFGIWFFCVGSSRGGAEDALDDSGEAEYDAPDTWADCGEVEFETELRGDGDMLR